MSDYRMGEAARLLGVSTDTIRRWVDEERLAATRTEGNQRLIVGADLARVAVERAAAQKLSRTSAWHPGFEQSPL